MLCVLSIRDIVLIDRVELTFEPGLCVLTGETGAGKSILLDALGLATGARADKRLVRHGAGEGVVTAAFAVADDHPAVELLAGAGVAVDPDHPGSILLRRLVSAEGPSRAFINDQPVSAALLQVVGAALLIVPVVVEQARALVQALPEWIDGLAKVGVPCSPVNTIAEVFADPHTTAREMRLEMPHPLAGGDGTVPLIGNPLKLSETPVSYRHAPPVLGQHSDDVLADWLQLEADAIAELRQDQVVA